MELNSIEISPTTISNNESSLQEKKAQENRINHPTFCISKNKRYKNLCLCYVCKTEDCQKIFKTNQELIEHIKTHIQIYTCPIEGCNKSFQDITNLRKHHKYHFPTEKKYYCPFEGCGKCFTASYNLTIHYRIHMGKKPYKCEKCGKGFFDKANYKYHLSSKHININTKKLMCQHKNCKHKSKSIKQRLMHHDKLEEFCIKEKNLLINLVMFYQESTISLLNYEQNIKNEENKNTVNNILIDNKNRNFEENSIMSKIKNYKYDDDLKIDLNKILLQSKVVFNNAINKDQYQDLLEESK